MKKLIVPFLFLFCASGLLVASASTHACAEPYSQVLYVDKSLVGAGTLEVNRINRVKFAPAPAPQVSGCSSNASGCNKTLANLVCTGKSWDPDGDGNYTCKPE
ncbi:MAG: hypothetical protein OQK12_02310 [Motiliproteus sp.]|nr:hypothetical protein [Motiliproteus sp.]MCW9053406.1 hypothetical protein [Motiliproteus sp.]